MKKVLLILITLSAQLSFGQDVVFHEDFDLPSGPDSVSTGVGSGGNVGLWDTVSTVAVSANHSYRVKGTQNPSTVYFETSSFSTVGKPYVRLEFYQIAKLFTANFARIQISTDSGQTWTDLNTNQYRGSDPSFSSLNYFNQGSHQSNGSSPWEVNNSLALPNNNWWKKELFDLTGVASYSSGMGTYTGYPNVKLRFLADFNFKIQPQNTSFSAGWFVDDVKVVASNCEVSPPRVDTEVQATPCYDNLPRGFIIKKGNNSYPIGILASDTLLNDSGIDKVKIYYQINNGNLDSTNLFQQGNTHEYKTTLTFINPGDTVNYYIIAFDNCGNETRIPEDKASYSFFPDNIYRNKCGAALCGQYPGFANSFPWGENFESNSWVIGTGNGNVGNQHRGAIPSQSSGGWSRFPDSSSNYGWSVRTGSTGTANTGPNSDHTTGSGKYLYTEFSPNSNNISSTSITTPCIDLRDSSKKIMSFYYHMFGSDIMGLNIDVDTGSNFSSYWIGYHQITGPQQISTLDDWKQAFVDLAPFKGKVIRLRFSANLVPPGDKSDIAIDDFEVFNSSALDVKVNEVITDLESSCLGSSNIPLRVSLLNLGHQDLNSVPMAFQLNNNSIQRDTLENDTLLSADTTLFSFSQLLSYPTLSNNTLKIWAELPNDSEARNDTITIAFQAPTKSKSLNFPYYQDFESVNLITAGSDLLSDSTWTLNTMSTGADWELVNSLQNDDEDGPLYGLGPNKKMLVLRDTNMSALTEAELTSSCIDLSNANNPELKFLYNLTNGLTLEVFAKETGSPWISLEKIATSSTPKIFSPHSIPLDQYAGKFLQLRFLVYGSGMNFNRGAAIDNIQIAEDTETDISLNYISRDLERLGAKSINLRPFNIDYNISGSGTVGSKLVVEYTSLCDSTPSVFTAEQLLSDLAPINKVNYLQNGLTFDDSIDAGRYQVKVWIESTADSINFNDTLFFESDVVERKFAPYFNDFENCKPELYGNGDLKQWELAQPSGGAKSGSMAFETNSSGDLISLSNNEPEILLPPFFERLDTLAGVEIRFWHKFNFNGPIDNCYGKVEFLNSNSVWANLTNSFVSGQNWKSKMSLNSGGQYVFHGNSSGWIYSTYPLDHAKMSVNAFRFATYNSSGLGANWIIDDFEIYVPPQYSASPNSLLFSNGLPSLTNTVSVKLFNSGRKAINSATVTIEDQNGNQLVQEQINLSSPLSWKKSRDVTLQSSLNLTNAIDELVIITSLPNNRNDAIPSDDTLRLPITLLNPLDSLPYCENFEDSAAYLPFANGVPDTLWKYTSPLKNVIFGTHSGNRAWITGLQGSYPTLVDKYLYTPPLPIEDQTCYKFSFWHWYDTEYNFDGGNVEFSLDTGKTWNVLGNHNDTAWYNTPFVQSLGGVNPGFSGGSGDWIEAYKEFKVFYSGLIQFRFRFASNASIGGNGWAIDDVCFEEVGGNCHEVSLKETPDNSQQVSLFPNPASSQLNLLLSQATDEVELAKLKIYDRTGKVIRQWSAEIQAGKTLKIDISRLPAGIYSLALDIDNSLTVKNFSKR